MEQTVYIDLYFLVNFSMDLLCLSITAKLLHRQIRRIRFLCAACVGGVYASVTLLLGLSGILGFFLDSLAALLLCAISFHTKGTSLLRAVQSLPVLLLSSMTLGGIMTALYHLLNRLNLPFELIEGDDLSVWIFALITAVSGIATLRGGSFRRRAQRIKSVTLEVTMFQKSLRLCAFVDSGNLLRDPVSGKSVIVADLDRLTKNLPPELTKACQSGDPSTWLSSHANAKRTRLIPTQTATGSSILLAIIPDSVTVITPTEQYPSDHLIAFAPLNERAAGFDAIIADE